MKKNIAVGAMVGILILIVAGVIVSMRTKGLLDSDPPNPFARLTVPASGELPVLADAMPEFTGISAWLNSPPLTAADLKGKVVLIDFWTYSCINCIRTLPYVTSWYGKYKDKGFVVIGVHTPEFAFEKEEKNVRAALARFNISHPVALDNDYGTWNAYANHYWPAHYLFDTEGRLRHYHFGEGEYDQTEAAIQALLKEAGKDASMPMTVAPEPDFAHVASPETYLGYARMGPFASPERVAKDQLGRYTFPTKLELNRFAFSGAWTVEDERAISGQDAKLRYRYSAFVANLVMGGENQRVEVLLDGRSVPEAFRGADLTASEDGKTYLHITNERLYEITNGGANYGEHLLELRFLDAGTEVYAFTFG